MKLFKLVTVALAVASLSINAFARIDSFGGTRTVVLAAPQNIGVNGGIGVTNSAVDVRLFDGVGKIDIFCVTNSGTTGGTLSCTVQSSQDQTNWTVCANVAVVTGGTSISYTNLQYGGTNLTATDTYVLPFTVNTPVAATAGWAIPNAAPISFNSNAVVTVSSAGNFQIGLSTQDYGRYMRVIWTPGGSVTNFSCGAILTGVANNVIP
jgi:hypothetical protein